MGTVAFQAVVKLSSDVTIDDVFTFHKAMVEWLEQHGPKDPTIGMWLVGPRSLRCEVYGKDLTREAVLEAGRVAFEAIGESDGEIDIAPFDIKRLWVNPQTVAAIESMKNHTADSSEPQAVVEVFCSGGAGARALLQFAVDVAEEGDGQVLVSTGWHADGAVVGVEEYREFLDVLMGGVPIEGLWPPMTTISLRIAAIGQGCVACVDGAGRGLQFGGNASDVERCLRHVLVDPELPAEAYLVADVVDQFVAPAGRAHSVYELLGTLGSSTRDRDRAAVLRMGRTGQAERVSGFLHGVSDDHRGLFKRREWKQREDIGGGRYLVRT